jgi:hypothetical protein
MQSGLPIHSSIVYESFGRRSSCERRQLLQRSAGTVLTGSAVYFAVLPMPSSWYSTQYTAQQRGSVMMNVTINPVALYFMHVPKTAGTTLKSWLNRHYAAYKKVGFVRIQPKNLAAAQQPNVRYVYSAHHGYPLYQSINRTDLAVVTVLRDPIERAVSEFYHHQRGDRKEQARGSGRFALGNYSLVEGSIDDHLAVPVVQQFLANRQTRALAGLLRDEYQLLPGRTEPAAPPTAAAPAIASSWLRRMTIVGITEEYDRTVDLISARLGIPTAGSDIRRNTNQNRPAGRSYRQQLQPETLEILEALNRDDRELYRLGCELFAEQSARLQAQPRRTYSIAAYSRAALRTLKDRFGSRRVPA